ncbi:MAG: MoaD/ThiS family protein [Candidatus Aenigmarchaeota archaeon]|nr:MoaD/ThiS family protein [Candidatus Aenigmarchaeota archaeon]MCK5373522.1 MoaD/ThiS family protein [Candidatus Aenigmarchaeota archaeon]
MNIAVTYEGKKRKLDLKTSPKVSDMLKTLDINAETVIVKVNNEVEPEDIRIKKENNIEIIKIISGG